MRRSLKCLLAFVLVISISIGIVGLYISRLVMAANLGSYSVVHDGATVAYVTSYGLPVSVQGALTAQGITVRSSNTSNYSVDGNSGFMCISAGRESPTGTGGTVYRCINSSVYNNENDTGDGSHNTLMALSGLTYSQIVYGCYSLGRNGGSSWAYSHAILSYLIGDDGSWFGPLSSSNAYSALTTFAAAAASVGKTYSASAPFYVFISSGGRQNLIALSYSPPAESGSVSLMKKDQNGNFVSGAVITLVTTSGADVSTLSANTSFTRIENGISFTTAGAAITIEGLMPDSDYLIHEVSAPNSMYSLADDIAFRTDASGNAPGNTSSPHTYLMVDQYSPISGEISFNKVSGDGSENDAVRTAVIEFTEAPGNTVADAMTGLTYTDNTGTAGYDQTGVSNNGIPRILFTASAVGTDITIRNLKPGASYMFHEVVVPEGYMQATDIIVNVQADGSVIVNGQTTDSVVMYNNNRGSMMGSIGIHKSFDSSDPYEEQRFWANASSVSFSFYHFAGDWETTEYIINHGQWPFVTYGGLNRGEDGAYVFWHSSESYRTYEWYTDPAYAWWPGRWWAIWSQANGRVVDCDMVGSMTSLPSGYYMVTEEWQEGRFLTSTEEDVWIETLNTSGWHDVSVGSQRRYAQIFYVSESMTYTVDWNGNFTGQLSSGLYWSDWPENNNPIFNYELTNRVTNVQNTGAIDLEKIDLTNTGVDGLRFELWRGASRYAEGHISTTESPYVNADGNNVYPIDWNYSTQYCSDVRNRDQSFAWQTIQWTNRSVVGSLNYGTYQLREIIPEGKVYMTPEGWSSMDEDGDGLADYFYIDVEVTENHQIEPLRVSVANRECRLEISVTKTDLWNGNILTGYEGVYDATFDLYADINGNGQLDDSDVFIGTESDTDRDGQVTFNYDLGSLFTGTVNYPADYLVVETTAPFNYYLNEAPVPVSVSAATSYRGSVDILEQPYTAQIRVNKYDADTGDEIPNAIFTIYNDVDGNGTYTEGVDTAASTYSSSGITDAQMVWNTQEGCYVSSELRSGRYVVVETGLPEGYFYVDSEGVPTLAANEVLVTIEGQDTSVTGFTTSYEVTVHNIRPSIHTTLTNSITRSHVAPVGENVELIDVVLYTNLVPGQDYVVTGTLVDRQTGQLITDANGIPVTASTEFNPDTPNGTVDVVFNLDTQRLMDLVDIGEMTAPVDIVAFENLGFLNGGDVCEHRDIDDEGQTVRVGKIHTGAIDANTNTQVASDGFATIIDYVYYEGLMPGREYTMTGTLHLVDYDDQGNRIDAGIINEVNSEEVLNPSVTFVPEQQQGFIEVEFVVNTGRFKGKTVVCFENLYEDGLCLMTHADINDEYQSIYIPSVHTTARSADTSSDVMYYGDRARLTDTVYYENLIPGMQYTVSGSLFWLYTDDNGFIHSGSVSDLLGPSQGLSSCTFIPDTSNGYVEIDFVVDTTVIAGYQYGGLVVMEDLYLNGSLIAKHADLNDENQTVHIPSIHTTAVDGVTGGKTLSESSEAVIIDRVYYNNLEPGREYNIAGSVQYVTADESGNVTSFGPLVQNDREVRTQIAFIPSEASGYVDITFTVNSYELSGIDRLVVFEDMFMGALHVASHGDIMDEGQTVSICNLSSSANGNVGGRVLSPVNNVQIIDTVYYEGLVPGHEYRMETDIMNASTGLSDAHCSTVFMPETEDGSIDITITIDGRGYTTEKLVVFECVFDNDSGSLIKSHCDWEEKSQTLNFSPVPQTGLQDNPFYRNTGYVLLSSCVVIAAISVGIIRKKEDYETN